MADLLLEDDEPLGGDAGGGDDRSLERMWPLDVSLATLGGLVIYTVVTRLDVNDPRLLHNPLTYAVLVPFAVVSLSLLLRNVASRFVRRSMQLGFLLSVLVHLLLLIAFFNVMILAPFWPDTSSGNRPARLPPRKTVPDYLFARSESQPSQPDWERPVDARAATRELPELQRSAPRPEPTPRQLELSRDQPSTEPQTTAEPQRRPLPPVARPSGDAPGELARESLSRQPRVRSTVDVPDVPAPPPAAATATDRALEPAAARAARRAATRGPLLADAAEVALPQQQPLTAAPRPRRRTAGDRDLPAVGDVAQSLPVAPPRRTVDPATPAGAAPAAPAFRSARESAEATRQLSDRTTPLNTGRSSRGARLESVSGPELSLPSPATRGAARSGPIVNQNRWQTGYPEISAGGPSSSQPRRRTTLGLERMPAGSLGAPRVAVPRLAAGGSADATASDDGATGAVDRLGRAAVSAGETANRRGAATDGLDPAALGRGAVAGLDQPAPPGPLGFESLPARRVGMVGSDLPEVAAWGGDRRPSRRDRLARPPEPAGNRVAPLRPFERRSRRMSGGPAAAAAASLVGPETEEAIELGLAYLAERQNENGSWSLQGHGEEVMMQSDTAATGLCLLAFQGAGYTHKEHQYADTVSRGIEFLLRTQRTNGDLYQRENRVSDKNAWLYSHGIAALALCEAYGMTRDPELRRPAQKSLDFIALSQDPRDGGWRYQPRRGSDTSVTGWMMMALKSGELAGLDVPEKTYLGIRNWLRLAQQSPAVAALYRYNPRARDDEIQGHGLRVSHTMTAVGLLARLYLGWSREREEMQRGAAYLADQPPRVGTPRENQRDTYYWYYATQVMFHMGGATWEQWNGELKPILLSSQLREGPEAGSWDPVDPIPDRWARYAGRIYVTTMNLLSLEVYYRHLPIYEETAR